MNNDLESFGFSDRIHKVDPDSPVYPSLLSTMKVDLTLSPDSDVWLIHEHPLPELMKWVEYDIDLATITLVSMSGKTQDLGMKVPTSMKKFLRRAKEIYTIHQGDDQIEDMSLVPFLVREPLSEN